MTKERLSKLEERIFLLLFFAKENLKRTSRKFKRKHKVKAKYLFQKEQLNNFYFEDKVRIIKFVAFLIGEDENKSYIKRIYKVLPRLEKIGFITRKDNFQITKKGLIYLRRKKISYKNLERKAYLSQYLGTFSTRT